MVVNVFARTLSFVVVMMLFVFVHFKALLWVRFVMEHHHSTVRVLIGVPSLDMAFFVGDFMPLLRIFMVSRSVAELVAVRSVHALKH